jgi:hypothetical protein
MADDTNQQGPWWARMLERYGLPTVLLIAGASALLTGIYRVGSWIAPLVERVTTQHIETMQKTDTALGEMVKTQAEVADSQRRQEQTMKSVDTTVQVIRATQESIDATLKRLPTAKPPGSE